MMMRQVRVSFTAAILLLWSASASLAAPSVSVVPSGKGVFVIQGDGMEGVAGINLDVTYDSSLANPSVTLGGLTSGSLMAANTNNPGSIKIAIISTNKFSSSGQIAVISFASYKGTGGIRVSASTIDSSGKSVSEGTSNGTESSASTTDSSSSSSTTAGTSSSSTTTGASSSSTTGSSSAASNNPASSMPTYLGTVTMPSDSQPQKETKSNDTAGSATQPPAGTSASTATSADQSATPATEESKKTEDIKNIAYGSVIERFRAYQGEKSPAILVALFNKEVAPSIRQEPAVALSNGSLSVRIVAALPSANEKSPNFALNGAKLVSLKKDDESGSWIIEALPRQNTLKASLTILTGSQIIEFPLTVAPPLKSRAISEADFAAFLKNPGNGADLNGDGRHDYIDDFIYTANYLVWMEKAKTGNASKTPQK